MISKGVKPASVDNPIKVVKRVQKKDDSALVAEEMAEGDEHTQDIADQADDITRQEKKEKQKKNDEFNRVSDDIKNDAASELLGSELIQLSSGIKEKLMAQLSMRDDEESISDLTNNAKEQIKSSNSDEKKEEKKDGDEKKEEKKEGDQSAAPVAEAAQNTTSDSEEAKKDDSDSSSKKEDASPKQQNLAEQDQENVANTSKDSNQTSEEAISNASQEVKVSSSTPEKKESSQDDGTNAIMITGATHSRELLSSQVPLFIALKLLHQGYLQNNEKY